MFQWLYIHKHECVCVCVCVWLFVAVCDVIHVYMNVGLNVYVGLLL